MSLQVAPKEAIWTGAINVSGVKPVAEKDAVAVKEHNLDTSVSYILLCTKCIFQKTSSQLFSALWPIIIEI